MFVSCIYTVYVSCTYVCIMYLQYVSYMYVCIFRMYHVCMYHVCIMYVSCSNKDRIGKSMIEEAE